MIGDLTAALIQAFSVSPLDDRRFALIVFGLVLIIITIILANHDNRRPK